MSLESAAAPPASSDFARPFARREDGVLCYSGTTIPIPGGSEVTAGDAAEFRMVSNRDGSPLAVLITRSEVEAFSGLSWVFEVGTLRQGEPEEYEVSWPVWQERSAEAVGVRAPEWGAAGVPRMLALKERTIRFMRADLEHETDQRDKMIAVAARLGEPRRAICETLGISKVRVNQIIDDLSPMQIAAVDELIERMVRVLRFLGLESHETAKVAEAINSDDPGLLEEMMEMALIETDDDSRLKATPAGERAELHLRSTEQKGEKS